MNFLAPTRAARTLSACFLALGLLSAGGAQAAGYYAQGGRIYEENGQELQVRGISHFGFNAEILHPQYLWTMGWKEQIAQIKALGFNAVRVPFVPETLYNNTPVERLSYLDPSRNADLIGKTPLQVLDMWMAEADRQGLHIMLDFHSVSKYRQYPTWFVSEPGDYWLTYNGRPYTKADWIRDLVFVSRRYAHLSHFFAVDVYNEPNGIVRWAAGDANMTDPANYWKPAVESAASAILAANPRVLIFVQGINGNWDGRENTSIPMNWGEDFQPQAYQPLQVPNDKLVLSPHTYGPDVYVKSSFGAPNFPANLAADWEILFGQFADRHPVIPGEWGGRYGTGPSGATDYVWQNAFVDYLLSKGIRSSFFWCYTPNSGDTGGILDDDLQVIPEKVALMQRHWGGAAPAEATIALESNVFAVAQNAGMLLIPVHRRGSTGAASVRYRLTEGTAVAGTDFTTSTGVLRWRDGATGARTIAIPILSGTPFIGQRRFTLRLVDESGAVVETRRARVVIRGSGAP